MITVTSCALRTWQTKHPSFERFVSHFYPQFRHSFTLFRNTDKATLEHWLKKKCEWPFQQWRSGKFVCMSHNLQITAINWSLFCIRNFMSTLQFDNSKVCVGLVNFRKHGIEAWILSTQVWSIYMTHTDQIVAMVLFGLHKRVRPCAWSIERFHISCSLWACTSKLHT